jgi:hypothetical protein
MFDYYYSDASLSTFGGDWIGGSPYAGIYPGGLGISDVAGALGIPIDWQQVDAINQDLYYSATYAPNAYGFIDGLSALMNSVGVPSVSSTDFWF